MISARAKFFVVSLLTCLVGNAAIAQQLLPASKAETSACIAQTKKPYFPSDAITRRLGCQFTIPNKAIIYLQESTEPGCRPYVAIVASKQDAIVAVRIFASVGGAKDVVTSVSTRRRFFGDRKANFAYFGMYPEDAPNPACSDLELTIKRVLCKRSKSLTAKYKPCPDIEPVIPKGLFKSVSRRYR